MTKQSPRRDTQISTEPAITREHIKNNTEVRGLLTKQGIKPENLPPEEDVKKVEHKLKGEDRKGLR